MRTIELRKPITEEQQQELSDVLDRASKALAIIETYDQARVDRLCQAVAWSVANKRAFTVSCCRCCRNLNGSSDLIAP